MTIIPPEIAELVTRGCSTLMVTHVNYPQYERTTGLGPQWSSARETLEQKKGD